MWARSPMSERSDIDPLIDADGVEQSAVVGDEDDRAGEGGQGLLELLDRRQVEMVGRLVEHEAVHAPRPSAGRAPRGCARPATTKPPAGRRGRHRGRTSRATSVRLAADVRPARRGTRRASTRRRKLLSRLLELADDDTRAPATASPTSSGIPPSNARSNVVLPARSGRARPPARPSRSRVDRSEHEVTPADDRVVESSHDLTGARRSRDPRRRFQLPTACRPRRGGRAPSR